MRPGIAALTLALGVMAAPAAAQDAVAARMAEWSAALGVECTHCHVAERWADTSKPANAFAGRMSRMLDALNAGPMKDLGGISCWTCHRGRAIPARLPRAAWETIRDAHAGEFVDRPTRAIAMSVYAASLGVDCSHCHERDRSLNTKAPKAMVPTMLAVFEEIPKHFDQAERMPQTQCYMCHQGATKPQRRP
jgi:hypothetical protein